MYNSEADMTTAGMHTDSSLQHSFFIGKELMTENKASYIAKKGPILQKTDDKSRYKSTGR